jgi:hypothetical protein
MNLSVTIIALIYTGLFLSVNLYQGALKHRVFIFLVTLDAFLFMLVCLGNVRFGECASSAAWDLYLANKWQGKVAVAIIDTLFFFSTAHCQRSWEWQRSLYE